MIALPKSCPAGPESAIMSCQFTNSRSIRTSMSKPTRPRRPTMTDIAKLAGVSQSTVSLVINHMSGARVTKETRDAVLRIARELGYPLERHAHAARESRNLVLYLTDELTTSPHAMQTID